MSRTAAALKTESTPAKVETHQIAISELFLAKEAPKGANLEVRDSGAGSPMTDDELRASIYAKGIIYPLMFKEHQGKKYVVVGNRRLKELRKIFADALSTTVQCQNVDDFGGDWREIAMDTNLSLPPHLVERYEMIVQLAKEQKLTEREVCARYGMSDMQYRRVMALGKMSPEVRQAWKTGEISAKTAQIFTLQPDVKEQEKVLAAARKDCRGSRVDDWSVRRRIVPQSQSHNTAPKIAFVGVEAAKKAGAIKQEDLFGKDHIVSDFKVLNKMVGDKLAAACAELVKEGWSWAMPKDKLPGQEYEYGDVHPDKKKAVATAGEASRIADIDALLNGEDQDEDRDIDYEALEDEQTAIEQRIASRGFSPDQKKRAGCIVRIGHDGELAITYGKVKPAERQKVAAAERRATGTAKPKKKNKPGEVTLSNALAERLSQQLEKGLSEAMVAAPYTAIAGMIAGFASYGEVVSVDVGNVDDRVRYGRSSSGNSSKAFVTAFEGALKSSPEQQAVVLAGIASQALSLRTYNAANLPINWPGVQALAKALPKEVVNAKIRANFDVEAYFTGVDLATIVAAVSCSMGPDFARDVAKMKKGAAVKFAVEHLKKTKYLPPALRTPHYDGPIEKAEPKKAKPVKSVALAKERKPAKKAKAKK